MPIQSGNFLQQFHVVRAIPIEFEKFERLGEKMVPDFKQFLRLNILRSGGESEGSGNFEGLRVPGGSRVAATGGFIFVVLFPRSTSSSKSYPIDSRLEKFLVHTVDFLLYPFMQGRTEVNRQLDFVFPVCQIENPVAGPEGLIKDEF